MVQFMNDMKSNYLCVNAQCYNAMFNGNDFLRLTSEAEELRLN